MSQLRTPYRRKYGNVPQTIDNITFASSAEAARYCQLKLMQTVGSIRDLAWHPKYPLMAGDTMIGNFIPDFTYVECATGELVVEDVKGMRTLALAKWKQKHFHAQYGIAVREIR